MHNHKIKSNTRQAGQDYETYYILRQTDLKVWGFSQL